MATKVKGQRLNEGATVENLGFNPDKRPIQGEGEPTSVTPEYIGQQYVDTTENKMYFATGTEEGNREAVGAGGGEFDPTGYYPRLHAGLTDQIYTDENTISIGDWDFRTTAGDVSVPSSGEAKLLAIKGAPLRRVEGQTDTLAQFEITATEGIVATIENKYKFIIQANNNTTGTYTFTLSGGSWDTDLSNWGIHETHEGLTDGTITVNFTAESRADLRAIRPNKLMATGVNQMGVPGYFKMDGYRVDNGEIKAADGSHYRYLYCVPAYGGVTNGYMARDLNGSIQTVGRCASRPAVGTVLQQNNIQGDNGTMWMPFEQTGWFVVEANNDYGTSSGAFSIHPRWSNQQGENVDGYVYHEAYLPYTMPNYNELPYRNNYGYGTIGLAAIGDVYDEINIQTGKYNQRIGYYFSDDANSRYTFILGLPAGTRFEYDNHGVYYVLESENVFDMNIDGQYSGVYTANDYGTEWILDENDNLIEYPTGVKTSYGTNLVDKLRTGVPSSDQLPRVMWQQQYNSLSEEQKNSGAITFIYTADKPDSFEVNDSTWNYDMIGNEYCFSVAGNITPAGYPFDVTVTSSDPSVFEITNGWNLDYGHVNCNMTIRGVGTSTISVTIGGVTKTAVWTVPPQQ